jgi:hypothetical protein
MSDEKSVHGSDGNDDERNNCRDAQSEQSAQAEIKSFFAGFWRFVETYFPPPIDENTAEGKKRKCYKEQIKFWLEFLGFFLGIIVAIIFLYQSCQMRKATVDAEGQLNVMKQTRIDDERGWVYVEVPNNALSIDSNNCVIQMRYVNAGKMPCIITGDFVAIRANTNDIPQSDPIVSGMNMMLTPNTPSPIQTPNFPVNFIVVDMPIYFFGTIYYKDISGSRHWTQFCYSLTEHGIRMIQMPFHNSFGDEENNQSQK